MRILVAFKVTPDYEALRDADWVAGPGDGVTTRFVRRVLDLYDESALELALRLRDALEASEAGIELGAVSVGGRECEPQFATLAGLGYERAARIEPQAALDFAPTVTAALLAGFVRMVDRSELLLLGCRSGPGDEGILPFLVAEELGWPCVTQVTEIEPLRESGLRVASRREDGVLRLTVRSPCVLAIGDAVVSHLRVPTLRERLVQRDRRADVLAPADVGVDVAALLRAQPCLLRGLERVDRARAGAIVPGETPGDKARALLAAHLPDLHGLIAREAR